MRTGPNGPRAEEPLSALLGDAVEQAKGLARAEMHLLRAEMRAGLRDAKRGAVLLAIAAVLGLGTAIMALVTMAAILVALGMAVWLAMLLTTLLAGAAAALLARAGLAAAAVRTTPAHTMEQLKLDRAMVEEQMR